jgi:hypothetical protein
LSLVTPDTYRAHGRQWPKAGHILEMAGKSKFELPSKKKMAGEIL